VKIFGAIETGGTKTVCAIGAADGKLLSITNFATRTPRKTFAMAAEFFQNEANKAVRLAGIGVGTFGPVDINPDSSNYGHILNTPKPGWSGVDIIGELSRLTGVSVVVDTDVNCALMGEAKWGAGKDLEDVIYLTIGTGIGGSILSGGRLIKGISHSEIGHMLIPAESRDRDFSGSCPFHGARCVEGLASGEAMRLRWGTGCENLEVTHEAWDLEARYLTALCINLILCVAPRRIILGGGVMQQGHLFEKIRILIGELLSDFIDLSSWHESLDDLIVPVDLDGNAGVLGGCLLANAFLGK